MEYPENFGKNISATQKTNKQTNEIQEDHCF